MTHPLRRVLLILACLALCGSLLAACGGDDEKTGEITATELLAQTFGSSASSIDTGRLDVAFQLDPKGLLALGGPIELSLKGPFAAPAKGDLPRFDVDFAATLARDVYRGGVLSTGKKAYVRLDDNPYTVDDAFVTTLREGLSSASAKQQPGLKALGIDPPRWVRNARKRGDERVAGVETTRISGDVNVARLLEDIDALLTTAGGAGAGDSLLNPKVRKQIAAGVKTAKVDIWTGAEDKLLRQLAVKIDFAFKGGETPIPGLEAGKIDLRLRLDDVNETTVKVSAPQGARPLSTVTGGTIGDFLSGLGEGLTSSGPLGLAGGGFLKCLTSAAGKSESLVRCISKLAR